MDKSELRGPDFELLRAIRHEELIDFAIEYFFRRPSWLTRFHHALSIATLAAIFATASGFLSALHDFMEATVAVTIIVLPRHDALHAAAYWLAGARDIRWGFIPRMLAAYVVAENFVASRAVFVFVALTPFVVINTALVVLAIVWPKWAVFFLWVLLWHVAGASGDWALLNFYWLERRREIFTFDEGGTSYFYGRMGSELRFSV